MPKGKPSKRYTGEFKQMVIETMHQEKLSQRRYRKLLYLQDFESMEHFCHELADSPDYYNHHRIKAKLKGLPPALHRLQSLVAGPYSSV